MPNALQLVLTASQREDFINVRDKHPKAYFREKVAALLKISEGKAQDG